MVNNWGAVSMFLLGTMYLAGCSSGPDDVLKSYLYAELNSEAEKAYSLLSEQDKKAVTLDEYKPKKISPASVAMSKRVKYTIKELEVKDARAVAFVEFNGPDFNKIFRETYKKHEVVTGEDLNKMLANEIMSPEAPMKKEIKTYELVKEEDGWKVFANMEKLKSEIVKNERDMEKMKLDKYIKEGKEHGLDLTGKTIEQAKKELCEVLLKKLPLRGNVRKMRIDLNKTLYDCSDPGPAKISESGYWELKEEISKVDGTKKAYLYLKSDPNKVRSPSIIVRCRKGQTEAFLSTDDYLGDSQNVVMRLDENKPRKVWMRVSQGNDALFFSKTKKVLKEMFGKKKLFVRYRTYSKGDREIEFDIVGLKAAVMPIRKLCKW